MNEQEIENKRIAKHIEDYKSSEYASNLYWVGLILAPLMMYGITETAYGIIFASLLISIFYKIRRYFYFISVLHIVAYGFVGGGWTGFLLSLIPAGIMGLACVANYIFYNMNKQISEQGIQ